MEYFSNNLLFLFFFISVGIISCSFYINGILEEIMIIKSLFYVDFFIFDQECRFLDFDID